MTSPTYDPTGRPLQPGPDEYDTEQPNPPLGEAVQPGGFGEPQRGGFAEPQPGGFAEPGLEYGTAEGGRLQYGEPTGSDTGSSSITQTARSEAASVKDTAVGAAAGVKDTAKSEVSNVAEEAKYQARSLVDQTRSELRGQASNQQSALAERLQGWASELGSMASKADESGPMSDFAQQASRKVGEISHWLENHEPSDLLEEVKRYARRRPVAFLAIAAAAGVLAGRVTRGAVAGKTSVDSDRESTPARAYHGGAYDYASTAPTGAAYGTRAYQGDDFTPRYGETVPGGASYEGAGTGPAGTGLGTAAQYPTAGTAVPEQPGATGTSYPNVTPVGDEAIYPPPSEGEVRR